MHYGLSSVFLIPLLQSPKLQTQSKNDWGAQDLLLIVTTQVWGNKDLITYVVGSWFTFCVLAHRNLGRPHFKSLKVFAYATYIFV